MRAPTTPPRSTIPGDPVSHELRLALDGMAKSVASQLTEVLSTELAHAPSARTLNKTLRQSLPAILERQFREGLLKDEGGARKRRATLLHALAAAHERDSGEKTGETLTSEAAATMLHVSRTHLNTLADAGQLGAVSRTAGGHRRIARAAVLAYQQAQQKREAAGLKTMAAASRRLGLYDDDLTGIPTRSKR